MSTRSRFNPSLLVGAMVNGIVEAPTMRPSNLQPVIKMTGKPGCRMTWCREKERCHCTCKKCKRECLMRDVHARLEGEETVVLEHSDGEPIVSLPLAEYEILRRQNDRLPAVNPG